MVILLASVETLENDQISHVIVGAEIVYLFAKKRDP